MINWILLLSVTLGAAIGGEISLRRSRKQGKPRHYQPLWSYRLLMFLGAFGTGLFLETSRVALEAPSERHVWHLIAASVFVFAVVSVQMMREIICLKRRCDNI